MKVIKDPEELLEKKEPKEVMGYAHYLQNVELVIVGESSKKSIKKYSQNINLLEIRWIKVLS